MNDPQRDEIYTYKNVDYKVLNISDALTQDTETGQWDKTVVYRTKIWSVHKFNRALCEFKRKFVLYEPSKKSFKLNAYELQVLIAMRGETLGRYPDEHWYYSFITIGQYSRIPEDRVRRTVRSLARKGLMEFARGLQTEDGETAGSGYRISQEGIQYVDRITSQPTT